MITESEIFRPTEESQAVVAFLGVPGSGKTTQCEFLTDKWQIPIMDMGAELRRLAERRQSEDEETLAVVKRINKGTFAPVDTVREIVEEFVESRGPAEGCLWVGFPRSIPQLEVAEEILARRGRRCDVLVVLQVPNELAKERLLYRGRVDDTEEIIERRVQIFDKDTLPVVDAARARGWNIVEVDGVGTRDQVLGRICEAVHDALEIVPVQRSL